MSQYATCPACGEESFMTSWAVGDDGEPGCPAEHVALSCGHRFEGEAMEHFIPQLNVMYKRHFPNRIRTWRWLWRRGRRSFIKREIRCATMD